MYFGAVNEPWEGIIFIEGIFGSYVDSKFNCNL